MSKKDPENEAQENQITWSSQQSVERSANDRRSGDDRRQMQGRMITVPDMRSGVDRRSGQDRRKVRLTITGRAMNI